MPKYTSLQMRLVSNSARLSKFPRMGDCCIWNGYCQNSYIEKPGTPGAYGRINLQKEGRSLKFPVHRVAKVLEEIILLVPGFDFYNTVHKKLFFDLYQAYSECGLSIDHLCKETLCINPKHLEWVYLSKNQQRKKWSTSKRSQRITQQVSHITRHYRSLTTSPSVNGWIRKIKTKQYRIKK